MIWWDDDKMELLNISIAGTTLSRATIRAANTTTCLPSQSRQEKYRKIQKNTTSRNRKDRKQSIYEFSIERQIRSILIFTYIDCFLGKGIKIFISLQGSDRKRYLSIYCRALRNQAAVCWRLRSRSSWGRRWSWWWWWWSSWCWWWWLSGCWGHWSLVCLWPAW